MNKFFIGALAVAALCTVSCKKSLPTTAVETLNDSVALSFGGYIGADLCDRYNDMTTEDKEQFLSAVHRMLGNNTNDIVLDGTMLGGQIAQSMDAINEREGLNLNPELLYKGFSTTLNLDSMTFEEKTLLDNRFMAQHMRAMQIKQQADSVEVDNEAFTLLCDSIAESFGSYIAADVYPRFGVLPEGEKTELLKAIKKMVVKDGNDWTNEGTLIGAQITQTLQRISQREGLNLSPSLLYEGLRGIVMQDSIDYIQRARIDNEFLTLHARATEEIQRQRAAERENAPDAQQNRMIARNFVENLKAQDPTVQTTESGLVYKIVEPGEDPKPDVNATVKVKYTGKHLNGSVFDDGGGVPQTFNLRGVVQGFSEGLQLIGKGGKATLYIPGELGYGVNGQPQAGIGPNEMLVFDVELVEIN